VAARTRILIPATDLSTPAQWIVIDEYLAVRLAAGGWPSALPDDEVVLPTSRHWRLLQALDASRQGQLSRLLDGFGPSARDGVRHPHPEVFGVLDPLPLLDEAAIIAARYGRTGWLISEPWPRAWPSCSSCGSAWTRTSAGWSNEPLASLASLCRWSTNADQPVGH
jgi:hypothetical protein